MFKLTISLQLLLSQVPDFFGNHWRLTVDIKTWSSLHSLYQDLKKTVF